ncbi:hypothetical protein PILCRDRAFT_824013 [Piloderma croceum F 1598]|uniref:Uncharacterized protein n=1 Tax=Piloderma croceum (strain F 1598) TaxID=765440 RepID=A0A0C3FGD6_PILCF|nr:hypothetical protein PILCRDRAFT_824013 [Piloderma croceum F 1598]
MPGRTRLYSEFIAQDAEADSNVTHISALYHSRLPLARLAEGNIQAPIVRPNFVPLFKRHKTMGLNARFDRMLERVDLTLQDHQPASSTTASSRQGRARARSAGSSSVSSGYDVPKTPVDAYDGLEDGRLGDTFSVIKMKSAIRGKTGTYYRADEGYDGNSDIQVDSDQIIIAHKEPLPDWLAITFSKLDPQNPLRRLVSSSTQPLPEVELSHEEPIFAFSHITHDQNTSAVDNDSLTYQEPRDSALQDWQELNPMDQQSHTNFLLPALSSPDLITNYSAPRMLQPIALPGSDIDLLPLTDIEHIPLPFSTPGPGSTVSLAPSHNNSRPTVSAQAVNLVDQAKSDVWPVFAMPGPLTHLSMDRIASPAFVSTHSPHSIAVCCQPNSEPAEVPASPSSYLLGEDFANNSFSSDLPPLPVNIHELPSSTQLLSIKNPFSMPGPRFHEMHSRPIYFDSPTEDPSDSDPLAPPEGYELDFRWEPFMQIGNAGKTPDEWDSSVDSDQENVENPIAGCFKVRKDTPEPEMTEDQASMMDSDYDRYPVTARHGHFPPYPQGSEDDGKANPSVTPEPTKIETTFAPAPGIFISPLRNKPTPPMVQDNSIDSPPNSPTPAPVTPRNKSTTLLQVSNTMLTVGRSLQTLQPNQAPSRTSTPSLPCSNSVTSRSVNINYGWQVARGASEVGTWPEGEDDSKEQGALSQVSNDSITSWSVEAGGR